MTTSNPISWPERPILLNRGVLKLAGSEAHAFLQGLVTNDIERLNSEGDAIYASLLTPQGKILFDFFIVHAGDHLLIDVDETLTKDLLKRLTFYKLRADVDLTDVTGSHDVVCLAPDETSNAHVLLFKDPRHPALGQRAIVTEQNANNLEPQSTYDALLVALGFPQGGRDFKYGDAFAHDAMIDQLDGLDYRKGCYVGQEVVSRMHHRGTARKRIVPFTASGEIEIGTPVKAGTATIGIVTSFVKGAGLAMVRLDRVAEAREKSEPLSAGDTPVALTKPDWVDFDMSV